MFPYQANVKNVVLTGNIIPTFQHSTKLKTSPDITSNAEWHTMWE